MSSLPHLYPRLSLHLTDRAHTPFISSPLCRRRPAVNSSSSSSNPDTNNRAETSRQSQLQALHSLTTTALASHDAAARLGLGLPSRIMVEHGTGGPVVLTSYIRATRKGEQGGVGVGGGAQAVPVPGSGSSVPSASTGAEGPQGTTTTIDPTRNPSARRSTQSLRDPGGLTPSSLLPNRPASTHQSPTETSTTGSSTFNPHSNSNPPPSLVVTSTGTNGKLPASSSPFHASSSSTPAANHPSISFSQPPTGTTVFPEELNTIPPRNASTNPCYDQEEEDETLLRGPTLLSLVVSPSSEDLPDARRAAARLERVGRELQAVLAEEGENDDDYDEGGEGGMVGLVLAPAPPGTEVGEDSAPGSILGTGVGVDWRSGDVTGDESD